jgi:hypothetical protein
MIEPSSVLVSATMKGIGTRNDNLHRYSNSRKRGVIHAHGKGVVTTIMTTAGGNGSDTSGGEIIEEEEEEEEQNQK